MGEKQNQDGAKSEPAAKSAETGKAAKAGKAQKKRSNLAISKIGIEGFKSIRDRHDVEMRQLTVLAGANSSGKSSLMQPLLRAPVKR